jgi:uncharacterized phiE125 gp8 family phage protein
MTPLDIITLQQAKDFLKVDFDDDDDIITGLIKSSVSYIEKQTQYRLWNRSELETTSFDTELFQFPINNMVVTDLSGGPPVFRQQQYPIRLCLQFHCQPGQFINTWSASLPTYYINMDVGYTDVSQIPEDFMIALRELITFWYEQRGLTKIDVPDNIANLIDPYKRLILN